MAMAETIREIRRQLAANGPPWTRSVLNDFTTVTLPESDCDAIRDLLIAERTTSVVEIGLAYGSSALAIDEALASVDGSRHIILDPLQDSEFHDTGWQILHSAGANATLIRERSQFGLPRLIENGVVVDAAFVDGSHIFHNVFVDLYFLQTIVKPGGLIILDDYWWPSVAITARYYETNLGWRPVNITGGTPGRLYAMRIPDVEFEPNFKELMPFWPRQI